jgi:hypothetical protein
MDANGNEKPHPEADEISARDLVAEENSAAMNNTANTNPGSLNENEKAAAGNADLTVGGFLFVSAEDAELARSELAKIEYLEKKMNYHLPENILAVYNKVMESKMFKTPPGLYYLGRMQGHLKRVGIEAERIAPIPVYNSFTSKAAGEISEGIAKQRIERRLRFEKSEAEKFKGRFRKAIYACLLLGGLILVMFYITLKSENPNIINYEQNLVNKYAGWEQELKERENAVREREQYEE